MQNKNPRENRNTPAGPFYSASLLRRRALSARRLFSCVALLGSLSLATCVHADDALRTAAVLGFQDPQGSSGAQGNGGAQGNPGAPGDAGGGDAQGAASDATAGPVRLARFSNVTGDVTWRDSTDGSWSPASQNMPLRQGAQVWVADGGRAEVQFDDGSRLRLDKNTLITLQTLFSDADGEFTEVTLNDGQAYLRLNNKYSVYQVNTPQASLKATGPAQIRVGGGRYAEFGVRSGDATVEGKLGKADLHAGDFLSIGEEDTTLHVKELPSPDSWDSWNLSRDEEIDNVGRRLAPHLPSNIALVADDLDQYGAWHNDAQYGWVWAPRNVDSGWRPYRAGHWTWVEPFGWTWVSTESWGWAPYHYGTWVHQPYGWGWCPGPATQYWSPGVVSFTENAGVMAWCPLAPTEVRYPSRLALGFRNGNWSAFFSIGGAAVYYPTSSRYCEPRPFHNVYVNRVTYVNHVTNVYNVTNITVNRNTYLTSARFVPANARWQGGTQVAVESFGGRGVYQPAVGGAESIFARGRVIAGPAGGHPVAGPQSVRVTAQSLTASRVYHAPTSLTPQTLNRAAYRASLPSNLPRTYSQAQTGQRFTNHPGVTGPTGTTRTGTNGTGTNLPGRTTDGKQTFNPGSNGPGRVTNNGSTGSRPTTGTGATGTTGRSSGLDTYLKERNARNGGGTNGQTGTNTGRTGQTGTNTGKPPITGDKNDTTPRRFGDGSTGTRTDTTTTHRTGDSGTTHSTDTPRRFGDGSTTRTDTTHRSGDGATTKTDTPRRFGDGSTTPRTGDRTGTSRTDSTTGAGGHTSGSGGDNAHSSHSGGTGSTGGSSGTRGTNTGKGDTGKSGASRTDTKSTDQKKDTSKDNSKDHKNP